MSPELLLIQGRSPNTDRSASIKPAAQQSSCNAPHYPTTPLPHYPTTPLPHYPTTPLPHYPTTPLPHYPTTPLPHYPTTPLPHYPTSPHPHIPTSPHPHIPISPYPHIPISPYPTSAAQQRNGVLNGAADAVLSCIVNVCIGLFLEALMKKAASSLPTYLSPAGRGPSKCCRLLISSTPSEAIYRMATHTALMLLLTIKNVIKCAVLPRCCGSPSEPTPVFQPG